MLIAPQNPFHALRFAETAYTAGDIPLALSYFLKVVEMSEDDSGVPSRAWFGVKLVRLHRIFATSCLARTHRWSSSAQGICYPRQPGRLSLRQKFRP